MAFHPLWNDTFAGYASQVAFENAYPYDPPGNMSSSLSGAPNSPYTVWGLTNGPSGGPGLNNPTSPQFTTFIDKVFPATSCRYFKVRALFDFTGYGGSSPLNTDSQILEIWSYEYGNRATFDGDLVLMSRTHASGNSVITIRTSAPYQTIGGPPRYVATLGAALLGQCQIEIEGKRSLLTETSPGVFAPDGDGYVHISINGVQVVNFTGAVWHGNASTNRTWNAVSFTVPGKMTNLEIYDSDECTTVPSIEPSETTPCCGSAVDVPGGSNPGDSPGENTSDAYQPWTKNCEGDGQVELEATPTDPESWAA